MNKYELLWTEEGCFTSRGKPPVNEAAKYWITSLCTHCPASPVVFHRLPFGVASGRWNSLAAFCRVNSFALQIGLESCGETGAKPFDVINDIITSCRSLFRFNTRPALNGSRHELHPITDAPYCISSPLYGTPLLTA